MLQRSYAVAAAIAVVIPVLSTTPSAVAGPATARSVAASGTASDADTAVEPTSVVDVLGKGAAGEYLRDTSGRQVILRGFNTDGRVKVADDCMPRYTEKDIAKERHDMGTNAVRLLLQWRCVEPSPNVYDDTYLDRVEKLVAAYNAHGMTVMLDMHQDVYSVAATPGSTAGNGAPAWATHMDGLPVPAKKQWWEYYVTPGVTRAWDNFWNKFDNHPELADHYARMWGKVASRFAGNKGVVGYDLMNEPYTGNSLPTVVERGPLSTLYQKCVDEIRKADQDSWVFVEPVAFGANFGRITALQKIVDPRAAKPKIAYAPHLYPLGSEGGLSELSLPLTESVLATWQAQVRDQARRLSPDNSTVPIMLGEFGLNTTKSGSIQYVENVLAMIGEMGGGAFYYSSDLGPWGPYDDAGQPRNLRDTMANCYVPVAAGRIVFQSTAPKRCVMEIDATTGLSQVYLPRDTFESVQVTGATIRGWDKKTRTLLIEIPPGEGRRVTVDAGGKFFL
ncbi:glycoside hydrolase family 5 protein [Austwickia chelonae]|uniref:glycoside hydrolase family 5 protein n=1 Tax=Austwickia chelonae TaxID=100225 RepID=UPI000E24363A|nr:cellulase family glycosylhydrolase [Austwickia chelonae]